MPVFTGTPGDDFITGTPGDDVIDGLGGNDQLTGLDGADVIDGGDDHDFIRAQGGNDTLTGASGDDYLRGGEGDDIVDGGDGYDRAAFVLADPGALPVGATVDLNLQGVAQFTGHGWDTLIGIEHVSGTALDDVLTGDGGDNWIWGEGGMDVLSGNGGNDLIEVGQGDATVDGGSGTDTLSFFNNNDFTGGVTVSLLLQGAAQSVYAGSDMTLSGFENLSGSTFDDNLTGDAAANVLLGAGGADALSGGDGDDSLYGDGQIRPDTHGIGTSGPITLFADVDAALGSTVDGDDVLMGGAGNDHIDGGGGSDTASFADLAEGVFVNLAAGFAQGQVSGDTDTLVSIENAIGSAFNDVLVGSAGANGLSGGDGNDQLIGQGGDDALDGGAGHDVVRGRDGADVLMGGDDNDYVQGGEGDDVVDGGAGIDRAAFFLSLPTDAPVGATVDLNLQGVAQDTGHGMDILIGIEHVSGTSLDDVLTGDGGDNWIWGEGGLDVLTGNGGDDLIEVGQGDAVADGGGGTDTLSFFNNNDFTGGVTASLLLQGAAQSVYAGSDMTLSGFENLSGSTFDDNLTGDAAANVLLGAGGADALSGGDGDDVLYGDGIIRPDTQGGGGSGPITLFTDIDVAFGGAEDGDDVLMGGAGNDHIDGGGGSDTASFADLTEAVSVNLGAGFAATDFDFDTLVSIENAVGTDFDDFLVGSAGANVLAGGDGIDLLRGLAGDDTLDGGASHDNLHGREGADSLSGGDGDDYLRGGEDDDLIDGGDGFDRAAFVTLDPGALLVGATVDLNLQGVAQDTGHGFDTLVNIEHVSGTEFDDALTGDGGDNWLWGEGGIDVLTGNGGDDLLEAGDGTSTLSGGSGVDTASFFDAEQSFLTGVTVSLAAAGAQALAAGSTTTLTGIENLSGSVGNDLLTGNGGANTMAGQNGDDTLNGGDGDDVLLGDGMVTVDTHGTGFSGPIVTYEDASAVGFGVGGNDVLNGGKGDDRLVGGAGDDTLSGGQGGDVFAFSAGSGDDVVTDYKKNQDSFELDDWGAYTVTAVGKDVLIDNGTDTILVKKAKVSDVEDDISEVSGLSARQAPASVPDDGADAAGFGGWADQSFFAQHGFRADGGAAADWHFG